MFEDLSSLHSAETQLSDGRGFSCVVCESRAGWVALSWGAAWCVPHLPPLALGVPGTWPPAAGASVSPESALFLLWERESKTHYVDSALPRGRGFRDEDVVDASCMSLAPW